MPRIKHLIPYWFNQAHLYHSNPRIRGGWANDFLANVLYFDPTTRQYDIQFEDGSEIPQDIIYEIYDVMEEQTVRFDWQKGDVLILNNTKVLHGRAPYSGQRRVLVAMVP
jgi:alpha-ketoglutarate-dependent taurine dioxygenase